MESSLALVFIGADGFEAREEVWDVGYPLYHYRLIMHVRLGDRLPALRDMRVSIDGRVVEPTPEYLVPKGAKELRFRFEGSARGKRFQRAA